MASFTSTTTGDWKTVSRWNSNLDANTLILLHMDGLDTGVLFPDSSYSNRTISHFGNAQTSTARHAFLTDTASLLLDGAGDYLTAPASTDFDFGTGDFTIECWVYMVHFNVTQVMVSKSTGNYSGWIFYVVNNAIQFNYQKVAASSWGTTAASSANLNDGAWNHVAVVCYGGVITYYINGVDRGHFTREVAIACPVTTSLVK